MVARVRGHLVDASIRFNHNRAGGNSSREIQAGKAFAQNFCRHRTAALVFRSQSFNHRLAHIGSARRAAQIRGARCMVSSGQDLFDGGQNRIVRRFVA